MFSYFDRSRGSAPGLGVLFAVKGISGVVDRQFSPGTFTHGTDPGNVAEGPRQGIPPAERIAGIIIFNRFCSVYCGSGGAIGADAIGGQGTGFGCGLYIIASAIVFCNGGPGQGRRCGRRGIRGMYKAGDQCQSKQKG